MEYRVFFIKCVVVVSLAGMILMSGCGGGGNKIIDNRAGVVARTEFDPSDLPQAYDPGIYTIGYGDIIDVIFLFNSEYSRESIKVRPDGRISYPYVGEIEVVGKTVAYIDSLLTDRFSEILNEPDITVILREFQRNMVYVLGEVENPGGYRHEDGLTLLRTLAMGRGLTSAAKKNGVIVIRRVAWDHIVGIEINVNEILKGNRYDLDIPISPFDIVMVPKSRIKTTEEFIKSVFEIVSKPAELYLKGWQVVNVKALYDFYRASGQR